MIYNNGKRDKTCKRKGKEQDEITAYGRSAYW